MAKVIRILNSAGKKTILNKHINKKSELIQSLFSGNGNGQREIVIVNDPEDPGIAILDSDNNIRMVGKDDFCTVRIYDSSLENINVENPENGKIETKLKVKISDSPDNSIALKDDNSGVYSKKITSDTLELEGYVSPDGIDDTIPSENKILPTDTVNSAFKKVEGNIVLNEETTSSALNELRNEISLKQDTLVSGQNIKTINSESMLGSGNIELTTQKDLDELVIDCGKY